MRKQHCRKSKFNQWYLWKLKREQQSYVCADGIIDPLRYLTAIYSVAELCIPMSDAHHHHILKSQDAWKDDDYFAHYESNTFYACKITNSTK